MTIVGDHPVPPQVTKFYFEVTILEQEHPKSDTFVFGFVNDRYRAGLLPSEVHPTQECRRSRNTWKHDKPITYAQMIFGSETTWSDLGLKATTGDTIGCGWNESEDCIYYTKNGTYVGIAYQYIQCRIWPVVSFFGNGKVQISFDEGSFLYNRVGL